MKFIENLTRDELVNLTMEEKEVYLQRELAKKGIEQMEEPKLSLEEFPKPDKMYYKVSACDYYFEKLSDAEKILETFRKIKGVVRELYSEWNAGIKYEGGDYQIKNPEEEFSMKEIKFYSENLYATVRPIVNRNSQKKKAYEDLSKAYRENQEKIQEIRNYVNETVDNAVAEYERERRLVSEYRKMFNLAEGNESIARNFFSNTYFNMGEEEINDIIALATKESQTAEETH